MKRFGFALVLATIVLLITLAAFGTSSVRDVQAVSGGPVFITGHDPDFHAVTSAAARNLLSAGLRFVTNGTYNLDDGNKFLWVESRIAPPAGHRVGENGLGAIGLSESTHYDRANAAELPGVDFSQYTAIAIASSFGGLLGQAELDVLIARSEDIKDFINAGGGLMALSECFPTGPACLADLLVAPVLYGFLPVTVSSILPDPPFVVTAFGAAPPFNLTSADLNDATHNSFGEIGGLNPIDLDESGQATTLAGVVIVNDVFIPADAAPPTCRLTAFDDQIVKITVQDVESGLASIEIISAHSVRLAHLSFDEGTTDPVVITWSRKNPDWRPFIHLKLTDGAGNVTECVLEGQHLSILDDGNSNDSGH